MPYSEGKTHWEGRNLHRKTLAQSPSFPFSSFT